MSNVLRVSLQTTIYSLADRGWSQRRIARELGINRGTVGRYLRLARKAKPAILTAGPAGSNEAKPAISTTGKNAGRKSQCEPLAEVILAKVEVGLSAQRIYQDLVEENGFSDSYESVKRFVRKLRARRPERIYRSECQPGEEVQLDFGLGAVEKSRSGSQHANKRDKNVALDSGKYRVASYPPFQVSIPDQLVPAHESHIR